VRLPPLPVPERPSLFTDAAMVFLRISGVATVLLILYGVMANERGGFVLLVTVLLASACAGTAVIMAARRELLTVAAVPEGPPVVHELRPAPPPSATSAPVVGVAAMALLAGGMVFSYIVTIAGALLAIGVVVWASALISNERRGRTLNLLPAALPIMAILVIASFIFFMSRILLAVPADASTGIALVLAAGILAGATFIAYRPSMSSGALLRALAVAAVLFVVGGAVAGAIGPRKSEHKAEEAGGAAAVELVAKNIKFDKKRIAFAANSDADLRFTNDDSGTPHNVAVYTDQSASQAIFKGDVVVGPITTDYKFKTPGPGAYYFHCDVHPNMNGTVTVR
jgi:plastocyanin